MQRRSWQHIRTRQQPDAFRSFFNKQSTARVPLSCQGLNRCELGDNSAIVRDGSTGLVNTKPPLPLQQFIERVAATRASQKERPRETRVPGKLQPQESPVELNSAIFTGSVAAFAYSERMLQLQDGRSQCSSFHPRLSLCAKHNSMHQAQSSALSKRPTQRRHSRCGALQELRKIQFHSQVS